MHQWLIDQAQWASLVLAWFHLTLHPSVPMLLPLSNSASAECVTACHLFPSFSRKMALFGVGENIHYRGMFTLEHVFGIRIVVISFYKLHVPQPIL